MHRIIDAKTQHGCAKVTLRNALRDALLSKEFYMALDGGFFIEECYNLSIKFGAGISPNGPAAQSRFRRSPERPLGCPLCKCHHPN